MDICLRMMYFQMSSSRRDGKPPFYGQVTWIASQENKSLYDTWPSAIRSWRYGLLSVLHFSRLRRGMEGSVPRYTVAGIPSGLQVTSFPPKNGTSLPRGSRRSRHPMGLFGRISSSYDGDLDFHLPILHNSVYHLV